MCVQCASFQFWLCCFEKWTNKGLYAAVVLCAHPYTHTHTHTGTHNRTDYYTLKIEICVLVFFCSVFARRLLMLWLLLSVRWIEPSVLFESIAQRVCVVHPFLLDLYNFFLSQHFIMFIGTVLSCIGNLNGRFRHGIVSNWNTFNFFSHSKYCSLSFHSISHCIPIIIFGSVNR